MAIYDIECPEHGEQTTWASMEDAMNGALECPVCHSLEVTRKYSIPYDHSANTFRPYWSHNLSTGADPVYVKTKGEEREKMAALGLQRYESGMRQDKERRKAEAKGKLFKQAGDDFEKAVLSRG